MPAIVTPHAFERRSLAAWLRACVVVVCLSIVLATALFQYDVRQTLLAKSEVEAGMLANSLAQHAADTFEVADVLLATLADRLKTSPGRSLDDIYLLDTALETQVRSVPRIRSLIAFDRQGRQFASSQPLIPDWFDVSGDEAFRFHAQNFDDAVRIGPPVRSPTTNDWLLTVTRRWNGADGLFGGIVMATVRVDYFSEFYRGFNVAGESGISLMRGDGILLARYPVREASLGRDLSTNAWFGDTSRHEAGALRFTSPIDGVARVHGYRRMNHIPLVMFVGISEASVLAGWTRGCVAVMVGAFLAAGGLGYAGWRFAAQIDARQRSEREWSNLALTDALTGVRNRRAFDETMRREWRLAQTRQRSLSLLFVDVDHFKAFNDPYGHPAGDACLRAVAQAIAKAIHRTGDCIARYGGEEFALLLSDTGPASALVIAERARQAVLMLGIAHAASKTLPLVSISIGVATQAFDADEAGTAAQLVERADRALYRAKIAGRNRVEMEAVGALAAPSFARAV